MPQLALYEPTLGGLDEIPAELFKDLFVQYIHDNEHDLAWEGFTQRDLYGFGAVTRDFILAAKAQL